MLKSAKMYENEIKQAMRNTWYDLRYQYVNGGVGCTDFQAPDSIWECHTFASIDPKTGELVGTIGYEVDWVAKSASGFFALSYNDGGSVIFARDILQVVDDIFCKYHLNRMDWWCWADNPTIKAYRKLCKRYGGREVGTLLRKGRLLDGFLHDSVLFELLSDNYIVNKMEREDKKKCLK